MLEHIGASLFVTIAIMTVAAAIAAELFVHDRSPRTLLAGTGFALLPLRLSLTGISDLLVSGVGSLITWVDRTGWTNTMSWGAGIGGLGILLIAVACFLPSAKLCQDQEDDTPHERPAAQKPKAKPAVAKGGQQTTLAARPAPKPGGVVSRKDAGGDRDLDEVKAILKKHGVI